MDPDATHTVYLGATRSLAISVVDRDGTDLTGVAFTVAVLPEREQVTRAAFRPVQSVDPTGPGRAVLRYLFTPTTRGQHAVYVRSVDVDEDDWLPAGYVTVL